jgi:dethiobiotin synthetase
VIELEHIRQTVELGAGQADLTLVEGAGGWRVPITDDADMATLAGAVGLPVLVVAHAGLGTINHSLLTVEAVRRDGCDPVAVILSRHPDDDRSFAFENAAEIERISKVTVLVLEDDPAALDSLLQGR